MYIHTSSGRVDDGASRKMGFAIRFRGTAEQGLDVGSRENESRIDRKMSSVV